MSSFAHLQSLGAVEHPCANCGKGQGEKPLTCSVCGTVYCDKPCQEAHWPEHAPVCKPKKTHPEKKK